LPLESVGSVISDEQYEDNQLLEGDYFTIWTLDRGIRKRRWLWKHNMRIRGGNQFIITGSATGEIPELEPGHYVKVTSFNIDDKCVQCVGPLKASSESLTHAAIYLADPDSNAVIHVTV